MISVTASQSRGMTIAIIIIVLGLFGAAVLFGYNVVAPMFKSILL